MLPIAVGIGGALLINLFFAVAKTRWPGHYFATSQILDHAISSSWVRYGLFRTLPPYVLGTLTAAVAMRYGVSAGWTLTICGATHLSSTTGIAVVHQIRAQTLRRRLALAHLGVAAVTICALWVASLTSRWWFPLTPGPDKYVEVALTGLVAAIAVHYLQKMTHQSVDISRIVASITRQIPTDLKRHLSHECARHRVDFDLAYAILITESVQRPRWIRLIERAGGVVGLAETHGIMQSAKLRSSTDKESISAAIETLAGATLRRRMGHAKPAEVEFQLEKHNKGREFQEFASSVFVTLSSTYAGLSSQVGADGSPALRIFERQRVGDRWRLTGDVSEEIDVVVFVDKGKMSRILSLSLPEGENDYLRRTWQARISISIDSVLAIGFDRLALQPKEDESESAKKAVANALWFAGPVEVYL